MPDTFLSPLHDYTDVATFCGIKGDPLVIQLAVDVAAEEVRAKCGPVLLETGLTFTSREDATALVLPFRVAALTSITIDGVAQTLSDFYVEPHPLGGHGGQVVRRVDGGTITTVCVVVYTSGWAHTTYPARLVGAGRELARHLWRTQLGNQRTGDEQGSAWLWPKQAEALASSWMLAPLGFA